MSRKADVAASVTPKCLRLAESLGFELVDVSLDRESAGAYLRIYIDRPEGMDLDGCERFHRAIQPQIEDFDYDFLEVCSPGADRPLKKDADFERALGLTVEVKLFRAEEGRKEWQGELCAWTAEDFTLALPEGGERVFPRKAVAIVRPVVDMSGVDTVDLGEQD